MPMYINCMLLHNYAYFVFACLYDWRIFLVYYCMRRNLHLFIVCLVLFVSLWKCLWLCVMRCVLFYFRKNLHPPFSLWLQHVCIYVLICLYMIESTRVHLLMFVIVSVCAYHACVPANRFVRFSIIANVFLCVFGRRCLVNEKKSYSNVY